MSEEKDEVKVEIEKIEEEAHEELKSLGFIVQTPNISLSTEEYERRSKLDVSDKDFINTSLQHFVEE